MGMMRPPGGPPLGAGAAADEPDAKRPQLEFVLEPEEELEKFPGASKVSKGVRGEVVEGALDRGSRKRQMGLGCKIVASNASSTQGNLPALCGVRAGVFRRPMPCL
jgi:hypothetical protein